MYPLHHHGAWLNKEGTGNTDVSVSHYHVVKEGRLQPDPSDGHTHELTMSPCGASAPRTVSRDGEMTLLGDPSAATRQLTPADLAQIEASTNYAAQKRKTMIAVALGAVALAGVLAVGGIMIYRGSDE